MKTVCCEFCDDASTETLIHMEQMDAYRDHFAHQHMYAVQEYKRIEELLRNVVWYNFETVARTWRHPWPESCLDTALNLHGMHFALVPGRGGHKCEKGSFPVYYSGTVRDAPPLPPEIVLHELKMAYEHVKAMEVACAAPYEWAPGGRLYEKMLRESAGVAAFSSKQCLDCDVRDK